MLEFLRGTARTPSPLPLFPLKTVLFPGGILPLKVFEQRYIEMSTECLKHDEPFGVCLLKQGDEVNLPGSERHRAEFAEIGTTARIAQCDVPQLGILHLRTEGGTRFKVHSHEVNELGLVMAQVTAIASEPRAALDESHRPLVELLDLLMTRVGREHFSAQPALDDASWVGYRLAELLPLPLAIKQTMLEINDSEVRLKVIAQFLREQGVL